MVQIDTKSQHTIKSLFNAPLEYNDVIHYFDTHWQTTTNLKAISQLDEAFQFPSKKLTIATISGTSGKSITMHYTSKILQEDGLKVGMFYSPHILSYNERFVINDEQISNQMLTQLANQVLMMVDSKNIQANTKDILTMIALLYFQEQGVMLALLENSGTYNLDPVLYCHPQIIAVSRIVANVSTDDTHAALTNIIAPLTPATHFVCADQNKQNLQIMHQLIESKGGYWAMPIRKLAPLAYPFEQLHGRCAALAERIAHIFNDNFLNTHTKNVTPLSLLSKPKGLRGRPTLEAKKASQEISENSLELFWNKTTPTLPYRFQLIEKAKNQSVLLDVADSIDALDNLFLGFRLLAYKREFLSVSLIIGLHEHQYNELELIKQLRHFTKKTLGIIAFCPIKKSLNEKINPSWDAQKVALLAKNLKIKAKLYKNLDEALTAAQAVQSDKNGLIIITGSQAIVSEYITHHNTDTTL